MDDFDNDFPTFLRNHLPVGPDRATDGPQEGHPGELGRPSEAISRRTGQTRQVGILGDQFDRRQVELIICKKCKQEFHSYVNAVLHSH